MGTNAELRAVNDGSYESMREMAFANPHHYVSYYLRLSVADESAASKNACFTALKRFFLMCGIDKLANGWENSAVKCQRLQSAYAALQEQLRVQGERMTIQEKHANDVMLVALTVLHHDYKMDAIRKNQKKTKRLLLPSLPGEGYKRTPYHCRLPKDLQTWIVIFEEVVSLLETWQPSILLMHEKCNERPDGNELDVNTIKMNLASAVIVRMLCFWTHAERTKSTIPYLTIGVTIGAFAGNDISSTDWKSVFAQKFLTGSQITQAEADSMTTGNVSMKTQLNALTYFIVTNVGGHAQGFVHRRFFPFLLEAFNLPYCLDGNKVNPLVTLTQSSSLEKVNNRSHSSDWPCKDLYNDCDCRDSSTQRSLIFDHIKRSILAKVGLTLGRCDRRKQIIDDDYVVRIESKRDEKCETKVRNTPLKRKAILDSDWNRMTPAEDESLSAMGNATKTLLSFAQAIALEPTTTISVTNANFVPEGNAGQALTPDKNLPLDGDKTADKTADSAVNVRNKVFDVDSDVDAKHLAAIHSLCELQMSKENVEINAGERVQDFVAAPPAISDDGPMIPGFEAENDPSFT